MTVTTALSFDILFLSKRQACYPYFIKIPASCLWTQFHHDETPSECHESAYGIPPEMFSIANDDGFAKSPISVLRLALTFHFVSSLVVAE